MQEDFTTPAERLAAAISERIGEPIEAKDIRVRLGRRSKGVAEGLTDSQVNCLLEAMSHPVQEKGMNVKTLDPKASVLELQVKGHTLFRQDRTIVTVNDIPKWSQKAEITPEVPTPSLTQAEEPLAAISEQNRVESQETQAVPPRYEARRYSDVFEHYTLWDNKTQEIASPTLSFEGAGAERDAQIIATTYNKLETTENELMDTRFELIETQGKLETTETKLEETQNELTAFKGLALSSLQQSNEFLQQSIELDEVASQPGVNSPEQEPNAQSESVVTEVANPSLTSTKPSVTPELADESAQVDAESVAERSTIERTLDSTNEQLNNTEPETRQFFQRFTEDVNQWIQSETVQATKNYAVSRAREDTGKTLSAIGQGIKGVSNWLSSRGKAIQEYQERSRNAAEIVQKLGTRQGNLYAWKNENGLTTLTDIKGNRGELLRVENGNITHNKLNATDISRMELIRMKPRNFKPNFRGCCKN